MTTTLKKPSAGRFKNRLFLNVKLVILLLFLNVESHAQGIKIGENGNPPHPSAILDVESTNKGLLMPRLTTAQRGTITSPTAGLQIYNTDTDCVEVYFASGGWQAIQCGCNTFPDATFSGSTGSINSPVSFSANGTGAGYTYAWSFASGTPSSSSSQTPTSEWSTAGSFTVELTVTDGDGCASSETAQVVISNCAPGGPWLFTNAASTGRLGPTQNQINAAYSGTNLDGNVTSNAGVQEWTVPATGIYRITAAGAQGGGANGGLGAIMEGEFSLNGGDILEIVVGQQGLTQMGEAFSVGGGGGSFVVQENASTNGDIYVIAGGGGGSPGTYATTRNAVTTNNANNGAGASQGGAGGTGGNGGDATQRSGGGGGFFTNGGSSTQTAANAEGGFAFINGSSGGNHGSTGIVGSFGGGAAAWQTGFRGSGGGGGYSGGGGGQVSSVSNTHSGGGGGSFNSGANQNNIAGSNFGQGYVTIEKICP